ncbi:MAG: phosphoribosyltransferase family protein [Actinomycetes bacterium]
MLGLVTQSTYLAQIGTQEVELPLVSLGSNLAIALMITVDLQVQFLDEAGRQLAEILRPLDVDVVVTIATMGIPVAISVAHGLGLDHYVVLHKTQKIHLETALAEPVRSITTAAEQRLLLDRARIPLLQGKRVAILDDVISTGASVGAALRLVRQAGGEVVGVGVLATEASQWRSALADDAVLVRALGALPLFRSDGQGGLVEDWVG